MEDCAPLAWKNVDELSGLAPILPYPLGPSDPGDSLLYRSKVLPSIIILLGRIALPFPTPPIPSPVPMTPFEILGGPSTIEVGRELLGVSFGVAVGVVDALSTLAFLDPDLGVIFELKKVFTGVEISSLEAPFGPVSRSVKGVCLSLGET